jgi:hypothetical protein
MIIAVVDHTFIRATVKTIKDTGMKIRDFRSVPKTTYFRKMKPGDTFFIKEGPSINKVFVKINKLDNTGFNSFCLSDNLAYFMHDSTAVEKVNTELHLVD